MPKLPVWCDLTDLRLDTVLGNMFTTRVELENGYQLIHPFRCAVDIDEVCHREWTLEFYSTFEMKPGYASNTVAEEWAVRFRLGGRRHALTFAEFGYACGLFTRVEADNQELMEQYFRHAHRRAVNRSEEGINISWNSI